MAESVVLSSVSWATEKIVPAFREEGGLGSWPSFSFQEKKWLVIRIVRCGYGGQT